MLNIYLTTQVLYFDRYMSIWNILLCSNILIVISFQYRECNREWCKLWQPRGITTLLQMIISKRKCGLRFARISWNFRRSHMWVTKHSFYRVGNQVLIKRDWVIDIKELHQTTFAVNYSLISSNKPISPPLFSHLYHGLQVYFIVTMNILRWCAAQNE